MIQDQLEDARGVGEILRDHGFSVHEVAGFDKACDALSEGQYHLLVADLEGAAVHRQRLLAELDQSGQQLDLALLSPARGDADPRSAFRGGAFRVLPGAVDAERLGKIARATARRVASEGGSSSDRGLGIAVGMSIADAERILLLATLESMGGDKRRAAEQLGISLKTLYNRLNQYAAQAHRGARAPA